MSALTMYWHTLRHLRSEQVVGRVRLRLSRPRIDRAPAPQIRRGAAGTWCIPAARRASMTGPERFVLLNEPHDLADCGWDDPRIEKLWRYNLHYFDDLNARESDARTGWHRALMRRWVRENRAGEGTGWEPYPTSLRIVNWIKWALAGNELPAECVQSLAVQTRWLARRLELHLLGNHLFANAKALVFAGLFFEGPEASGWLNRGMRILARELPEQILADGGHFERSPMYHALALEDVADLCNITIARPDAIPDAWRGTAAELGHRIPAMIGWFRAMSHPDGEIAFFNDASMGIAPPRAELERYVANLGLELPRNDDDECLHLADSGYVRVAHDGAVALIDVAPVGPDYLPAHAHADTLSFELSIAGQRVFVNSGTSRYGEGAERLRQRGTRAHNTVIVDGVDSSEVWGSFRVARRARPVDVQLHRVPGVVLRGSHDGYRRLPGRVTHTREWRFEHNAVRILDEIRGAHDVAEARFHVHPDVEVSCEHSERAVTLRLRSGEEINFSVEGGVIVREPSTWHPEFGISVDCTCLSVHLSGDACVTRIDWARRT